MFHIPRLRVRLEVPIQVLFNLLFCLDFLPPNMESNSLKALLLWIATPRTVDELGQVLTIWCLHVTPGSWTPNVPLPRNLQVPFSHMLSGLYLPPSANSPFQITWTNSCSQLFRKRTLSPLLTIQFNKLLNLDFKNANLLYARNMELLENNVLLPVLRMIASGWKGLKHFF